MIDPAVVEQINEEVHNIFSYLTQNEPRAKLVYIQNKDGGKGHFSSKADVVKGTEFDEAQFWSLFGERTNAADRVIKQTLYDVSGMQKNSNKVRQL